jgi:ankyrin repeat protein/L-ascorbate metabolism protein UlaG (beta-lactamase superfamily)
MPFGGGPSILGGAQTAGSAVLSGFRAAALAALILISHPAFAADIHEAVRAGDLAKVKTLVAADPKTIAELADLGKTPLHIAAAAGHAEIVSFLLAKGADIDAVDDLGQTPLHLAASAGHGETVDLLVTKGADPKAVCRDGRNLLHCVAAGGLVGWMERLIGLGLPVDGPDRYGRTPLFKAAEAGRDTVAEFLLDRGVDAMRRDYYQQTPLHEAAFSGNLRLLDLLVRHGAVIDAVNQEGSTPLLYISQAGRAEAMDWLLDHGAHLDVRNTINETPLSWPLVNGFEELVEKLWPRAEALKDRDLLTKYPLHRVAYHGNLKAASFLLAKGVPVDLQDESGRTPFQRAAQGGNVDLARMLLDRGADVDAPDPGGSTPLHLAVKKGRTEMVRFLLGKKANPDAKDGQSRTPRDLALEYSYPVIADILEAAGKAPTSVAAGRDVKSLLAKPLRKGQAIVWSLGHCGFAVKTKTHLLIFDYLGFGARPEKPSLANGFIEVEDVRDQNVVVFVTHSHRDHFSPAILDWRPVIPNITYVFGWKAREGDRTIDMPPPRATAEFGGLQVFTVNDEHDSVPEVAYLVKVDGLAIYHAGDYVGPVADYEKDMAYFLDKAGTVDIAFIGQFRQAESLKPKTVFPIHAWDREYMYGAFAREAGARKLPSRVICPENKGDRFDFF